MAIKIGDTAVTTVKVVNGSTTTTLKDIMVGSTHVWCVPPSLGTVYYVYKDDSLGANKTQYSITFQVVNNSAKSVAYTVKVGGKTGSGTITGGSSKSITIDFGQVDPGLGSKVFTVSWLGRSVTATATCNNYSLQIK